MSSQVQIALPWPPSVNHYWHVLRKGKLAGRVIISDEGKSYRKAIAQLVMLRRVPRVTGKLAVRICACIPDRRTRDLDNVLKATLDSLKHAGVYADDGDIDDLHIVRGPLKRGGELQITITEIPGQATTSGELFAEERAA